jgi:hypothetical protein
VLIVDLSTQELRALCSVPGVEKLIKRVEIDQLVGIGGVEKGMSGHMGLGGKQETQEYDMQKTASDAGSLQWAR